MAKPSLLVTGDWLCVPLMHFVQQPLRRPGASIQTVHSVSDHGPVVLGCKQFWVSIWSFNVKESGLKKGQGVRGLSVIDGTFHLES